MKYDFTSIVDRKRKDSIAVDLMEGMGPKHPKEGFDLIPMWIADMNFAVVPTIQEAIIERVKHPMFGYFNPSEEYINSIIKWQEKCYGVVGLEEEHIDYENGVLGCVMSSIDAFSSPGDCVLLHSPTYVGFTMSLENAGRKIIHSDLVQDENGVWRMNYEDMESKIKDNKIHVAIFCSPHNPCGRVWEREEIEKAMDIYRRNDCIVISDEIWSDLVLYGNKHIPTQSVNEDARNRTIAVYAPSKTFSLAGLVGSYHIIYNQYLRDRVRSQGSKSHYNNMNVLSMHALIGAYKPDGYEWLCELREVLAENIDYAYDYIVNNFKGVSLFKPQGTYMLFINCEEWCRTHNITMDELYKAGTDVGVAWQEGSLFNSPYSIRLNLALPKSLVIKAFDRLKKYVFKD